MLTILKAKPIQVTMVNPVPFKATGVALATRLENCGESAATAMPQIHQLSKKSMGETKNRAGEMRQKAPEISSEIKATLRLPKRIDKTPPKTQAKAPQVITTNVHRGIEKEVLLNSLKVLIANGVKAQKAYSSHMCPKYPKAAFLKGVMLKSDSPAFNCNFLLGFLKGPLGIHIMTMNPPKTANKEVIFIMMV